MVAAGDRYGIGSRRAVARLTRFSTSKRLILLTGPGLPGRRRDPMETHMEQQESMFADPAEIEAHDYADELAEESEPEQEPETEQEPENMSVPEPIFDEESEAIFSEAQPSPVPEGHVATPETPEPAAAASPETVAVEEHKTPASEPESPAGLTPLSSDDFSALEDRVLRAVTLVRQEREARIAAEDRAAQLKSQLEIQIPIVERLEREVEVLRLEREQVRQRVERLLAQLDALEL